jgi:radical SAM protein with 4Fe4S-binding SPASM domain
MDAWQLTEAVSLRPEVFGGIAFHRQHGFTLEVDAEAYRFLRTCVNPCPLPPPDHPAARVVPQLAHLGFLTPVDPDEPGRAEVGREKALAVANIPWPGDGVTLSAPETVHLAITARCNLACPGCYVPHFVTGPELGAAELRALIDQWVEMRVFQLAVGGGEPLLRQDVFDVLGYAREQGIVPNLTTNGTLLTPDAVRRLERAGVARVNLSWCGPGDRERDRAAVQALRLLLNSTLRVGINLLVTRALLPHLPQTLARLQALGVRQVTILRPKPPAILSHVGAAWYPANRLRRADLIRLRGVLNGWQGILHLEVDSALVGLMGDTGAAALRWRGIHGCTAGRRICTIWPDGRVSPCSFLADISAGSMRQVPFAELWRWGKGWEALRDPTCQPQGGCNGCEAAAQCGGARCVARYERGDPFAGDGECPHSREETGCAS